MVTNETDSVADPPVVWPVADVNQLGRKFEALADAVPGLRRAEAAMGRIAWRPGQLDFAGAVAVLMDAATAIEEATGRKHTLPESGELEAAWRRLVAVLDDERTKYESVFFTLEGLSHAFWIVTTAAARA